MQKEKDSVEYNSKEDKVIHYIKKIVEEWKNRQDRRGAKELGDRAERLFAIALDYFYKMKDLKILHGILEQADREDDMRCFVDFYLHIYEQIFTTIQVKSQGHSDHHEIWVELHGKEPDHIGWVNSPYLDIIAYQRTDPIDAEIIPNNLKNKLLKATQKGGFFILNRQLLKEYCDKVVDHDAGIIYDKSQAYHREYRRREKDKPETCEITTLIHLDELLQIDPKIMFLPYAKIFTGFASQEIVKIGNISSRSIADLFRSKYSLVERVDITF